MAPTIAAVLSFIPTNIWGMIKNFVKTEKTVTFDTPFKLSTKYTPALFVIMMCLSFANQFFRNVEIDCTSSSDMPATGGTRGGYGGGSESELNNYCWNYETFLVAKALEPGMRGRVSYPGIWSYNRGEDELVKQKYYKYLWFGIGKMAVLAFLPLFLWKFQGATKIKSLLDVQQSATEEEQDEIRASFFIETVNFNNGFGWYYFTCKSFATFTPLFIWFYLRGFIGKLYGQYGVDVMLYIMDGGDPWPNPMDALFPKIAKCEWAKYGYTGDLEVKAAQCQLPMNNLTQWSFFLLWWWLALVFFVNMISYLYFSIMLFVPFYRRSIYRKFVSKVCRDDVEMARNYTILTSQGSKQAKKRGLNEVINVRISFGDWLVLYFLQKNLQEYQFRSLVRKVAVTSNPVLQLKPIQRIYNEVLNLPAAPPAENGDGSPTENIQMKFMDNLLNGSLPPAYVSCDENASDSTLPGEPSGLSSGKDGIPPGLKMGFTFEAPTTSSTPMRTLVISPPAKIDRRDKLMDSGDKGKGKGKPPLPAKPRVPRLHKPAHKLQNTRSYEDEENWD